MFSACAVNAAAIVRSRSLIRLRPPDRPVNAAANAGSQPITSRKLREINPREHHLQPPAQIDKARRVRDRVDLLGM